MATLFSNSEWSVDKISTIPLFKLIYTSTFIRCWIAGSARMFLSDFACSSKIRPAVLGSSKELTTSSIAIKRSITCNQQKLYNTCKYIAAHIQAPHIKVRRDMWWWAHVLNPYFDFHNILPEGYIGYMYIDSDCLWCYLLCLYMQTAHLAGHLWMLTFYHNYFIMDCIKILSHFIK